MTCSIYNDIFIVMRKKKGKERRKAERIFLPLEVSNIKNITPKEIEPKDISGIGIKLIFREPVCKNDKVTIFISLGPRLKRIKTLCEIRWCKKLKDGRFLAGLKFLKIENHVLFNDFICEKMLEAWY